MKSVLMGAGTAPCSQGIPRRPRELREAERSPGGEQAHLAAAETAPLPFA